MMMCRRSISSERLQRLVEQQKRQTEQYDGSGRRLSESRDRDLDMQVSRSISKSKDLIGDEDADNDTVIRINNSRAREHGDDVVYESRYDRHPAKTSVLTSTHTLQPGQSQPVSSTMWDFDTLHGYQEDLERSLATLENKPVDEQQIAHQGLSGYAGYLLKNMGRLAKIMMDVRDGIMYMTCR